MGDCELAADTTRPAGGGQDHVESGEVDEGQCAQVEEDVGRVAQRAAELVLGDRDGRKIQFADEHDVHGAGEHRAGGPKDVTVRGPADQAAVWRGLAGVSRHGAAPRDVLVSG